METVKKFLDLLKKKDCSDLDCKVEQLKKISFRESIEKIVTLQPIQAE